MPHVEGPWMLLAPGEGENDSPNFEVHDPYGRTATVYGDPADEEVRGTGKLITAAPDLLAALKALYDFASILVERHGMDGDDTMTDADHAAWQEAAGSASFAITNARG